MKINQLWKDIYKNHIIKSHITHCGPCILTCYNTSTVNEKPMYLNLLLEEQGSNTVASFVELKEGNKHKVFHS